MEYFKTTDPGDASQGDLSKRVYLLKCEKGGWDEMCEVSEKWYKEGETAGVATVQQWFSEMLSVAR